MGANAVTTVPVYTAGEVLTAADMNITNSGIPVFATTTTRDAAFGGTGEKTLAEGQFAYIEATNTTQYYDGAAWQSVGISPGLVLVKAQTIGTTVSSVTVSDAFNSTYDNYKILISGGDSSTELTLNMTLGASATQYYAGGRYTAWGGGGSDFNQDNGTSWQRVGWARPSPIMNFDILNPFLAKLTMGTALNSFVGASSLGTATYMHNSSVSYSAFTLTTSTGTLTGGTIRVYGYANS